MINVGLDIANHILAFMISVGTIITGFVGLIYSFAHLRGRVATLEDNYKLQKEDNKDFKVRTESENQKVDGRLDSIQVTLGQILEANAAFRAELRVRFEGKNQQRG